MPTRETMPMPGTIHTEQTAVGDYARPGALRRTLRWALLCIMLCVLGWGGWGCAPDRSAPQGLPPVAEVRPETLITHGHVRIDDYYWLRDREDPAVSRYLEAENAYVDAALAHTAALQDSLFEEIKNRLQPDESTVPYLYRGHYYYTRYEPRHEYPLYCRRRGSMEAPEEVMLDANAVAEGHGFFSIRGAEVSPNGRFFAFPVDTTGRRFYTLHVKDLRTGELLSDRVPRITCNFVWAADGRTLFYTKQDPVTLRHNRIYRHRLGDDPALDELVYEETDDTFWVSLETSMSGEYLFLLCEQTVSTEVRYLKASAPEGPWQIFTPRERGHEYHVDHVGDRFYVRTNWGAENFRLMSAQAGSTRKERWEAVVPHDADVFLEDFALFSDYLVVQERIEGLPRMRVLPRGKSLGGISQDPSADPTGHEIDFGEDTYVAYFGTNREPESTRVRYIYESLTTPNSVFDYDMATGTRTLLKQDAVLGGYDPNDYATERILVRARDGEQVPVSLVYPADLSLDGHAPLLLYGYGAYGSSSDPYFSPARVSLLERGFVYAIAHVRGGQERGRWWYEQGRLLEKKNTFTDFIDCAQDLIDRGYTSPDRLFAYGSSAGGLLVGAVMNMAPDLFAGVIADVPWVDVVTTMLDDSIPLTTSEYDEWGNPNDPAYYDYMLSYSPYDRVEAKAYPALLIFAGWQDSQVQYWEPAKWAAKLRALKTGESLLLLHTNMEAGHGGTSGRFRAHRETALMYAFMLTILNQAS